MQAFKLYQGPSRLTGAPIVAIATADSRNPKTGPMLQTWILPDTVAPTVAVKTGEDRAVCGDCRFRHSVADGVRCYVRPFQGPGSVWRKYQRGGYPDWDRLPAAVTGVRLGSYGDPAAVPASVWLDLLWIHRGLRHTGYTHQWRNFPELRGICMASVDNAEEQSQARADGWRTFRVSDTGKLGEILCPASSAAGHKTTCDRCGLCSGSDNRGPSIYIPAH